MIYPHILRKSIDYDIITYSRYERHLALLPQEFKDKHIINIYDVIKSEDKINLYPQQDFHWRANSHYTNLVASEIAKKFNQPYSDQISSSEFSLASIYSDIGYFTKVKLSHFEFPLLSDQKIFDLGIHRQIINNPNISMLHYFKNKSRDKKILVVGDSFTSGVGSSLALYFGEVITVDTNNLKNTPEEKSYLHDFDPDYIVYVIHGPLPHLFSYNAFIQKIFLSDTE